MRSPFFSQSPEEDGEEPVNKQLIAQFSAVHSRLLGRHAALLTRVRDILNNRCEGKS